MVFISEDYALARSEGLIIEELDGELLVYDSKTNMAHALEAEAAAVWHACDGQTDTHILAVRCSTSDEQLRMTLARLGELGLIEDTQADQDGDTRRSALRKIGIAGAGLASASAINSILVPTAAAAASCLPPGQLTYGGAPPCCAGSHPISNPVGGPAVCCLPAGACATMQGIGAGFGPFTDCCNGSTPDSSCPSVGAFAGARCT